MTTPPESSEPLHPLTEQPYPVMHCIRCGNPVPPPWLVVLLCDECLVAELTFLGIDDTDTGTEG